ncbi:MAG: hypothetical protein M0Z41_00090 [Peptococcaceae bacterium]|jgi:hypothetical protein|nr:hypothetical protein [Peptococcaceae bacterium]
MRTFIVSVVIVLGTVAWLVQAVVAGYDSQFSRPGMVSTWQVRTQGDGFAAVTVWGQSFTVPADGLPALLDGARTYTGRLPGVRGVPGGNNP